ncbi:hypothetical protein PV08_03011 [Exophiala spinifera]|uniref:Uncharacterized protein n=1 Tax=Exophiala spinifera TaxID=91928 RepID=A0A0D2A169_9EURO|nr:uncharacterized protein PV08_03011 [Exophiala spinifera]KIW18722.1 hypothetical protein PV08_03011 [Exophiala spinifera]
MSTALRQAAVLKPEIRLAQALSEFESTLDNDQKATMRSGRSKPPPSPNDVMGLTLELDKNSSGKKRCFATRLTSLLQCLQQFSTAIDTVVGGSQSLIASGIWAAVKLTLHLALGWSSFFDKLSTLLMNVGRTCPRYQEIGILFSTSAALQRAICEYMIIVVDLCRKAVVSLQGSFFKQVPFLKSFETEFGQYDEKLRRAGHMVHSEVNLISAEGQQLEMGKNTQFRSAMAKFSKKTSEELDKARQLRRYNVKTRCLDTLSSYDYQKIWKQARRSGTINCVYEHEQYRKWFRAERSTLLWCTGILGAGKTVIAANVVEHLAAQAPNATIAYFFCRFDEAESLDSWTVIGSLISQLLLHAEREMFEDLSRDLDQGITEDRLTQNLPRLLQDQNRKYFIVLDGLDACSPQAIKAVAQFLKDLLEGNFQAQIFCSSRPGLYRELSTVLQPRHHISCSELTTEIDKFLWVVFQLTSICSATTDEEILQALSNLPHDLPETYQRILAKVDCERLIKPEIRQRIFQILSAAHRPLTLEELREAISIVPGETEWDPRRLVNNMQRLIDFCGGILNVEEEYTTVHFAHNSIKQFLLQNSLNINGLTCNVYNVDLVAAAHLMGEICVTYLNFNHLKGQLTKVEALDQQAVILPHSIVQRALPRSTVSKMALTLLKSESGAQFNMHAQLKNIADSATSKESDVLHGHAFYAYSRAHWLAHTKCLTKTSKAFKLWYDMVEGHTSSVSLPWSQRWNWAVLHDHSALIDLMYTASSNTHLHVLRKGPRDALWTTRMKSHEHLWLSVIPIPIKSHIPDAPKSEYPFALAQTSRRFTLEEILAKAHVNDRMNRLGAFEVLRRIKRATLLNFLVTRSNTQFTVFVHGGPGAETDLRIHTERRGYPLAWNIGDRSGFEILEALLRIPEVDLRSTDEEGFTALALAVRQNNTNLVKILFKAQGDRPHVQYPAWRSTRTGESLLMMAVQKRNLEMMSTILVRQPLTVNWIDKDGSTALVQAIQSSYAAGVQLLLDCPENYAVCPSYFRLYEMAQRTLLDEEVNRSSSNRIGQAGEIVVMLRRYARVNKPGAKETYTLHKSDRMIP